MESTDQQILALLALDGRMSYTDIGRETGLSTSAAQQRVRRLEQRGVIKGYRAVIDPEALGKMVTAFVSLDALDPANDDQIPGLIEHLPEIVSCFSVAGTMSYILVVQADSPSDLENSLTRIRKAGHVSTNTTMVLTTIFKDRPQL